MSAPGPGRLAAAWYPQSQEERATG
jgi:hypothetical protein